nr:uncharacterized protein LOC129271690 [Lytechinus pictus]
MEESVILNQERVSVLQDSGARIVSPHAASIVLDGIVNSNVVLVMFWMLAVEVKSAYPIPTDATVSLVIQEYTAMNNVVLVSMALTVFRIVTVMEGNHVMLSLEDVKNM